MRDRLLRGAPYLLLAIAVTAVFLPSLRNEFTNWDDSVYVYENPDIRHLDVQGLTQIFHPETLTAEDWTPLVTFSHAIEYQLVHLEPALYHATNVALHVAATLVILGLLLRVGVPLPVSFVGALLFGIHPLQVESVVWISGRKNLMSALFGFAAASVYMNGTRRSTWVALGLFGLSCMSKGIAIVIPPLMVAGLLVRGREVRWRRELLRLAPFFLLALGRGLWTVDAQSDVWARTAAFPFDQRMAVMSGVVLTYLRQFFLPTELRAFYSWPLLSWTDSVPILGLLSVVGLTGLVVWWARKKAWIAYLGAFVPITLFPMLNVFPAPFFQADRYVYMTLPAAGALVAAGLYTFAERLGRRWVAPALLAVWCGIVLVPTTLRQIPIWHDSYTLWTYTLEYEPRWHIAYNNLGLWYQAHEDLEDAVSYYEQSLAIRPGFFEARLNLALAFYQLDRIAQAETLFRELLADEGERPKVYHGLAQVLHKRGAIQESEASYRKSLALNPINPEALTNLGALLYDRGRFPEALTYYDQAVRQDPLAAAAYNNRGNLLRALSRLDDAAASIERAIELDANYAAAYSNLGAVLVDAGKASVALPHFHRALDLDPELASAASNLGNAYFALGNLDSALASYDRALELQADFPEALSNSANALSMLGRADEAQARYRRALEVRPQFAEAKYGLGRSLLANGHPAEALPFLQAGHRAMPGFVEAAAYLAHAAWKTGDRELAAQSFAHVIRLQPGRVPAYQNLARVLVQLDRRADAEVLLRKALNLAELPALLEELASVLEGGDSARVEEIERLRARARELGAATRTPD
ncbi:MAG: tetratricopeptide repeat protein, partial [Myxococcota bacterium]